jgi:hypothetical protein
MTIHIPRWSVVAAVVLSGLTAIGGVASAARTADVQASAARFKQKAGAAKVHGLQNFYGKPTTAEPAGPDGIAIEGISVAVCPHGLMAISGGWNSADTTQDPISITSNEIGRGLNRWLVIAKDTSTDDTSTGFTFQATVLCG